MFQTTNQPFKESKHQMESSIGIFLARTRFVCRQHGDTALKKKAQPMPRINVRKVSLMQKTS